MGTIKVAQITVIKEMSKNSIKNRKKIWYLLI